MKISSLANLFAGNLSASDVASEIAGELAIHSRALETRVR
jgi:hypothetical protein